MYKQLYRPDHPRADVTGMVAKYILVAEEQFGMSLPPRTLVHHKDFDKSNDSPDNLLFPLSRTDHQQLPRYQAQFIISRGLYNEFLDFWGKARKQDKANQQEKKLEEKLLKAENEQRRLQGKLADKSKETKK